MKEINKNTGNKVGNQSKKLNKLKILETIFSCFFFKMLVFQQKQKKMLEKTEKGKYK